MKTLLKDPSICKDPHKCVIIWSSKAYRMINNTLRSEKTLVDLHPKIYKYTKRFLDEFLIYFKTYGLNSKLLKKDGIKNVHRGVHSFDYTNSINDHGFIATSKSKEIAETFARRGGGNGYVLTFKTNKLPRDVPFVLIDTRIREYLLEEEVLFLPGTIVLDGLNGTYNVDPIVYDYMSGLVVVSSGGDDGCIADDVKLPQFGGGGNVPVIDLKGKYVVWWRAIVGRPVEIMTIHRLPKRSDKQVMEFWRKVIEQRDKEYEHLNMFIPAYKDLFDKTPKTDKDRILLNSYNVYMAIYDARKKKVEHFHFGIVDELAKEINYNATHEHALEEILKSRNIPV